LREVPTQDDLRLYINEDALPRTYWVPDAQVAVGTQAAIDMLTDDAFDPTRQCVVDALSPGIGTLATANGNGAATAPRLSDATCSVEDLSPEHVRVRVNAPSSGITVLADSYAEGWTVNVNGVRQPILKVNGLYRGVVTPQGISEIDFVYRPLVAYFARGIAIAVLTLAFLFGLRVFFHRSAALVSF